MSSPYKREWIHHEYQAKKFQIMSRDPTKQMVYPNQAEAANEIFEAFLLQGKVAVTLIALPQAGKTGTFLEVAYRMCTFNDDTKAIDPEQLLIITGMSDREWRWQTSDDMLTTFQKRVKHRGQFESVPTLLNTIHDALIIIDECHIAAEKEQSMSAMLRDAGLLNIDELRRRRIFLLEVSATPGHTLYDTQNWGADNHSIVILKESEKYVGFRNFIAEKRIHDSYDLTKPEEVLNLLDFIRGTFPEPRYHIIRLAGKKSSSTATNLIRQYAQENGWIVNNHNSTERMWDLDHHMQNSPRYHSIILIKEFWRAGKRLCDKYIGIVHEPKTQIEDTNVTSQGLTGRLCGNDKRKGPGAAHAFCNTGLIHDYLAWIDAKGDYSAVLRYKSKSLTAKKGRINAKESFGHHTNMEGVEHIEESENPQYALSVPEIEPFTTSEAAKDWVRGNFRPTYGPSVYRRRDENGNENVQGMYIQYRGKSRRILTMAELSTATDIAEAAADHARIMPIEIGQGANTSARIMPIKNASNIVYVVIYKPEFRVSNQPLTNRVIIPSKPQQSQLPF
jgi:hypothetical protein